jgi:hypothetical protein
LARVCCFYFENESDCQKFIGPPATWVNSDGWLNFRFVTCFLSGRL